MAYIYMFGLEIESVKDFDSITKWWEINNNIVLPNGEKVIMEPDLSEDDTGIWVCFVPIVRDEQYGSGGPTSLNDAVEMSCIRYSFYKRLKTLSSFRIATGDIEACAFNTYDGLLGFDWYKNDSNFIVSNEFYNNCKGKEFFEKFSETHYWIPCGNFEH